MLSTDDANRPRGSHIRRAARAVLLVIAACLALALVGVAAAQSSQNFDLACRGAITVAGALQTTSNGSIAMIGAAGQPGAGISSSGSYAVRGGFVQPDAPIGQQVQAAKPDAGGSRYLPFIADALARIVRPCTW